MCEILYFSAPKPNFMGTQWIWLGELFQKYEKWVSFSAESFPHLLAFDRGQKFHSSALNYEWNLERTVILPKALVRPTGRVGRITQGSHITPLCSLLHMLLKDKCMCSEDEWKLSYRTSAILKYFCPLSWVMVWTSSWESGMWSKQWLGSALVLSLSDQSYLTAWRNSRQ